METQERKPAVSIIMAAYNRSNVLKYAVASVVRSTFADWELLVIGDACTDDTAEVVASFNDARIRFVNLEKNIGEQSGPNNEGFRLAKGRYIAYLNQDDLWFPDHLEKSLRNIRETNADWVFSLGITSVNGTKCFLQGVCPDGVYDPLYRCGVSASLWLVKREILQELGGWRFYRKIRIVPSQDLLIRAWRSGKRICVTPSVTAIIIQSGSRVHAYAKRDFKENARYYERMCSEPGFRETEMLNAAFQREADTMRRRLSFRYVFRDLVAVFCARIGLVFGILPLELLFLLRYPNKGKFIDFLRKQRGLPLNK